MATFTLPCVPTNLKSIEPYLEIAADFENLYPSVGYFCRIYALQKGLTLYKADEDLPFLLDLISLLTLKSVSFSLEAINQVEDLALKFIEWGDTTPPLEKYNEVIFKSFYSADILLDVCLLFGELKATTAEKKKCIQSRVVKMQKSRDSVLKDNQASFPKEHKPHSKIEETKAKLAEESPVKRKAAKDLCTQPSIKELLRNQSQTAQILYVQSKDDPTNRNVSLQNTPVDFSEPDREPRQVSVDSLIKLAFVAAEKVSKSGTFPRTGAREISSLVKTVIPTNNSTATLDEAKAEGKALQSVNVLHTLHTAIATSAAPLTSSYPIHGSPFVDEASSPLMCESSRKRATPTNVPDSCISEKMYAPIEFTLTAPVPPGLPPSAVTANSASRTVEQRVVPSAVPFPVPSVMRPEPIRAAKPADPQVMTPNAKPLIASPITTSTINPVASKQIPSKQIPSKQIPSKQIPSKQIPSKQIPSKQIPSKHVASIQLTTASNAKPIPKTVASTPVGKPVSAITFIPPTAKAVVATPIATTIVVAPIAKLVSASPVTQRASAIPVTKSTSATPVAKPATPVTKSATPVTKSASATSIAKPATPVAKPASATSVTKLASATQVTTPIANPVSSTPVTTLTVKAAVATPIAKTLSFAMPVTKPVVASQDRTTLAAATSIAATPISTPTHKLAVNSPTSMVVPATFDVTPVSTRSTPSLVSLENCERTGHMQVRPTQESNPTQLAQHQPREKGHRRRLKCVVS